MKSIYELYESILDSDTKAIKNVNKTANLIIHPYLAKGKKQRLLWRDIEKEAYDFNHKSSEKTPEYLKFICDNFIDRVIWKYPEITYHRTEEKDIKMGYSEIPAKLIVIWYNYKGKEIGFRFNTFFSHPYVQPIILDNGKERGLTWEIAHELDMPASRLFGNKDYIEKYKKILDTL